MIVDKNERARAMARTQAVSNVLNFCEDAGSRIQKMYADLQHLQGVCQMHFEGMDEVFGEQKPIPGSDSHVADSCLRELSALIFRAQTAIIQPAVVEVVE